jgi:hypothetical protein
VSLLLSRNTLVPLRLKSMAGQELSTGPRLAEGCLPRKRAHAAALPRELCVTFAREEVSVRCEWHGLGIARSARDEARLRRHTVDELLPNG